MADLTQISRRGSQQARFATLSYSSANATVHDRAYPDGPLTIVLSIDSDCNRLVSSLAVSFFTRSGTKLVNADTVALGQSVKLRRGRTQVTVAIERLHLTPGTYIVGLWLASRHGHFDFVGSAAELEVVEVPGTRVGARPPSDGCVTCTFSLHEGPDADFA
jgi:hypothetical protein